MKVRHGRAAVAGIPVPFIIFVVVAAIAYFVLNHTTYGKSVYAVGGNPVSAWLSGINVNRIRFSVYVISGFLAGLAGLVAVARVVIASMDGISNLMLDSVATVVIGGVSLSGGRGTLIGAILGLVIISVVSNGMNVLGLGTIAQGLVRGLVIVTAVGIDVRRRR